MSALWPDTTCPVCGRLVDLDQLSHGDRVMAFHFIAPRTPKECDGSRRSVAVAWTYAKKKTAMSNREPINLEEIAQRRRITPSAGHA